MWAMSEVEGEAGSAADSPAVMGEREAPVLPVSQSSPRPVRVDARVVYVV